MRRPFLQLPELPVDRIAHEKSVAQLLSGLGPDDKIAAFDTFGGMSRGSLHVLKQIALAYASRFDCPQEATRRFWASLQAVIIGWTGDHLAKVSALGVE